MEVRGETLVFWVENMHFQDDGKVNYTAYSPFEKARIVPFVLDLSEWENSFLTIDLCISQ